MKANQSIYKGLEELNNSPEFEANRYNEFPEKLPSTEEIANDIDSMKAPRRDFLKMMGFSLTAATVASCTMPVRKVVPYLNKPGNITPGLPNYYASTYASGGDYASILVKTREGRPIKIEGNTSSTITKGATSARVQASVLSLYDSTRLKSSMIDGKAVSVDELNGKVIEALANSADKPVALVTGSILSPSTKKVIADFTSKYKNVQHVTYDAISASGIIEAHKMAFGKAALPTLAFEKAEVIVSVGADFLGDWISSAEYAKGYSKGRKVTKEQPNMSRHYQFEGTFSMTGTNADYRTPIRPSAEGEVLVALYNEIAKKAGVSAISGPVSKELSIAKAANDLWKSKGKSIVVAGSNDVNIQMVVVGINQLLNNYGATVDINTATMYKQGVDADFVSLVKEMNAGNVGGVIFYNANPVYNHPMASQVVSGIQKLGFSAAISERMDETAELVQYVAAERFYLESWNDAEPREGHYSLCQPVISPLFEEGTRQGQDTLLNWMGADSNYYDYMTSNWASNILKGAKWDDVLREGVYVTGKSSDAGSFSGDVSSAASKIKAASNGEELVLYSKVSAGDGTYSTNPWSQEVPDPVTKVTWDNYLMVGTSMAEEKGWSQEQVVTVEANGYKLNLPVVIQPGVKNGVVAVAVGYGRTDKEWVKRMKRYGKKSAGIFGGTIEEPGIIGQNAYPFAVYNGTFNNVIENVSFNATSHTYAIAQSQVHHHINTKKRSVVREASLGQFKKSPYAGYHVYGDNGEILVDGKEEFDRIKATKDQNLYPELSHPGHKWGMSIDLNSCIGCSACVVSCNAENNIPVVGKYEVQRRHDMHWMRIDRYFISSDEHHRSDGNENPRVIHQPMICQHCDNAPCENVCPVNATNHSKEGLNQMIYNRCVGTRYCENNCPYKVRRFNWYDYTGQDSFAWNEHIHPSVANEKGDEYDDLVKMVLNPDVTVRSRGVIEKCSFCVQKIQYAKLEAKKESRRLADGEVKTACQTGCPTDAIEFGDVNNKESNITKKWNEERNFFVLEEIHTLPSVGYLTKIRNIDSEDLQQA